MAELFAEGGRLSARPHNARKGGSVAADGRRPGTRSLMGLTR